MYIQKTAAVLLTLALLTVPASAHHGRGHCHGTRTVQIPVCTVEGCTESGRHTHNGVTCCGSEHSTGYCDGACPQAVVYALCNTEGCTIAGRHFHDGAAFCGAAHTGEACDGTCQTRPLCTAEDCTQTGYHIHNNVSCCGASHESGWCDGSCQKTAVTAVPAISGHHH